MRPVLIILLAALSGIGAGLLTQAATRSLPSAALAWCGAAATAFVVCHTVIG
ncbi:hypothetical protein [Streptomyces sp. R41]|uniref:Uncharacterized protein n=1 Tax=Streptomyces sp. R41 TaxID=3238632 RepID=A0AB39RBE0_9ACTN